MFPDLKKKQPVIHFELKCPQDPKVQVEDPARGSQDANAAPPVLFLNTNFNCFTVGDVHAFFNVILPYHILQLCWKLI